MLHGCRMPPTSDRITWSAIRNATQWTSDQAEWVLAELKRSGLSAPRFGALHNLGVPRISYWRARLQAVESASPTRCELVEITAAPTPNRESLQADSRIEIALSNGRRLSVEESVDIDRLRAIVSVLDGTQC